MSTAIKDADFGFTLTYNGFQFGPLVRYSLRGQPEYDPARRTVIYVRYVLSVTSWQYANTENALSADMLEAREKLMTSGGRLTIEDIGWGDTTTGQTHPEIAWGPMPLGATFTPLGGGLCWQLEWQCEFKVSECASPGSTSGTGGKPFLVFNYDVDYSHDELGFTTRSITGLLQIPQDRRGRAVADVPLNYRRSVRVPVPPGYKRVRSTWRENSSQNTLSFSLVDQQLQHEPFPVGIAAADVEFSVGSQMAITNAVLQFRVAGSLETLPGWPKALAALKFFQIVYARLLVLQNVIGQGSAVIPQTIQMSHSPFGRASRFAMTYQVTTKIGTAIFNPNLLYAALPDSNYAAWVDSQWQNRSLRGLWDNGGQTDLRTSPADIVDLCDPTRGVQLTSAGGLYPLNGGAPSLLPSAYFSCPNVSPSNSWLAYEPTAQLVRHDGIYLAKRDSVPTVTLSGYSPDQSLSAAQPAGMGAYVDPGDTLTRAGAPEQLLIFKGKAVRIRYPVEAPRLRAIEGVELDLLQHGSESTRGPSAFGCPTFYGRWIHIYRPRAYLRSEVLTMPHPQIELAN